MQIQWVAAIDTCHRRGHLLFAHVLYFGVARNVLLYHGMGADARGL